MKIKMNSIRLVVILTAVMVFLPAGYASAEDYAKLPVILKAADLLPKDKLAGNNYKIQDEVKNDGLVNTYRITTDDGPLRVEGNAELMIRINELNALWMMDKMERTGVFKDALVKGVKAPVQGAVELVKSPIDTTTNIVKGAGRFLSNIGRSIVSDDPYQDNVLKVATGYDVAKRTFAFEFGIDPYTDYEPVVDRLGEIARAAVAGGLAPRAAMGAIDSDVVTVMRISAASRGLRMLVRDNPPGELYKINKKKLESMGVPPEQAETFLSNHIYNPQEETLLVGELERIGGAKGQAEFIAVAGAASEHSVALFYRVMAEMMAGYHTHVEPIQRMGSIGGVPHLVNKSGAVVILGSLDYIFPTRRLEDRVTALDRSIEKMGGATGKELWIAGRIDTAALDMFKAKGWKVTADAGNMLQQD